MSALSSVVLPDPVPPETRMLRRERNTRSASDSHVFGEGALLQLNPPPKTPASRKRRTVIATLRTRGRNTDGNPRAVVQARIDNRRARRVQAQRTGDVDGCP